MNGVAIHPLLPINDVIAPPKISTTSRALTLVRDPAGRPSRPLSACTSIVGMTVLAYLAVLLWGGWVWDDLTYIVWNPRLEDGEGLRALWSNPGKPRNPYSDTLAERDVYWWPLLYSSFWLERWLWGSFHAGGFHATNIAIHSVNACLVFVLLRRFKVPGAWLAALVFAVHPGQMVAPALVMGRDLMACLCVLLALATWFPAGPRHECVTWRRVVAVCLLVLTGSLFKTQAVIIPAALAVVHWWRGGRTNRSFWVRLAPVIAISAFMAAVAWYVMAVVSFSTTFDFTFVERLLIAARSPLAPRYSLACACRRGARFLALGSVCSRSPWVG